MRKRKYLIGALVGVIGALTFSSVASAAPTAERLQTTLSPKKQSAKVFGGVSLHNIISHEYDNFATSQSPRQTVFSIPPDVKFTPGNIPVCPVSSVQNKPDAAARAACPQSITGQGSVTVNGGALRGTVTFFRGTGSSDIIVHTVVGGALVLDILGDISGRSLTFTNIPNTPGNVLSTFDTTFNKRKTGKKTFYVMARCGKKKKWSTTETTSFYSGESLSASSTQRCQVKK
jgi:hypothetical protein